MAQSTIRSRLLGKALIGFEIVAGRVEGPESKVGTEITRPLSKIGGEIRRPQAKSGGEVKRGA